jgi:hypothetical protein
MFKDRFKGDQRHESSLSFTDANDGIAGFRGFARGVRFGAVNVGTLV